MMETEGNLANSQVAARIHDDDVGDVGDNGRVIL